MKTAGKQISKFKFDIRILIIATSSILIGLSSSICPLTAQKTDDLKKQTQKLPAGKEILANYIKMSGGQEAYDKIKNRVSDSTLEIVGQGISIDIKTYAAKPNKVYVLIDSKITGKVEKGSNGKVFWENTLTGGPVVHDGVQREIGLRDSAFERFVYWDKIYESAKSISESKVGDFECYEVVLTPKKTRGAEELDAYQPTTLHFDKKNYLIRKIESELAIEAGKIKVVAYPEDYKTVDGIKFAHQLKMEMLGQKRVITVKKLEHNVKLPDDQFALPDEVKKLLK
jgi:hypothetical protein